MSDLLGYIQSGFPPPFRGRACCRVTVFIQLHPPSSKRFAHPAGPFGCWVLVDGAWGLVCWLLGLGLGPGAGSGGWFAELRVWRWFVGDLVVIWWIWPSPGGGVLEAKTGVSLQTSFKNGPPRGSESGARDKVALCIFHNGSKIQLFII